MKVVKVIKLYTVYCSMLYYISVNNIEYEATLIKQERLIKVRSRIKLAIGCKRALTQHGPIVWGALISGAPRQDPICVAMQCSQGCQGCDQEVKGQILCRAIRNPHDSY